MARRDTIRIGMPIVTGMSGFVFGRFTLVKSGSFRSTSGFGARNHMEPGFGFRLGLTATGWDVKSVVQRLAERIAAAGDDAITLAGDADRPRCADPGDGHA